MVFCFLRYFQFPSQNNSKLILLSFSTTKPHNLDCCLSSHFLSWAFVCHHSFSCFQDWLVLCSQTCSLAVHLVAKYTTYLRLVSLECFCKNWYSCCQFMDNWKFLIAIWATVQWNFFAKSAPLHPKKKKSPLSYSTVEVCSQIGHPP